MKCDAYCASCTKYDSKSRQIVALCGIGNDCQCFVELDCWGDLSVERGATPVLLVGRGTRES